MGCLSGHVQFRGFIGGGHIASLENWELCTQCKTSNIVGYSAILVRLSAKPCKNYVLNCQLCKTFAEDVGLGDTALITLLFTYLRKNCELE